MSTVPNKKIGDRKIGKVVIGLTLLICLFWICAGWTIGDGEYYLTSRIFTDPPHGKPSVNDIVGKWHLSEDSIKQLHDLWGRTILFHEIEFRADGTFRATKFPRLMGWSDVGMDLNFYTGTGRWNFDKLRFKPWSIQLYYDQIQGGRSRPSYCFLQGQEPPFKMYETGTIVFERE